MNFLAFVLSSLVVYVALATLLHLQFGRTGIVNFGVVGFVGLGMYGVGIMVVQYSVPFWVAVILATIGTGVVAYLLGWVVVDLAPESVLVATLAFATILFHLVTAQSDLTGGVVGLGTVPRPVSVGTSTEIVTFLLITALTALVIYYAHRVNGQPYGRLLLAIRDNEKLAKSLGKQTLQQKLIFFAITCAGMAFFGAMLASVNQFLVPRMLLAGVTFTVWIALLLGGQSRVLGGLVGVLLTVGLFDVLIETYLPVPEDYAQMLPDIKLAVYGLTLVLVLMFRPHGALGQRRRGT